MAILVVSMLCGLLSPFWLLHLQIQRHIQLDHRKEDQQMLRRNLRGIVEMLVGILLKKSKLTASC